MSWPYLDSKGLVTVGVGLLIEANGHPTDECFSLPWTVDGQPATRAQISTGWDTVNAHTELAGKAKAFGTISRLRLDDQAINASLMVKTKQFWSELHSQLVGLEEWPADAQLALLDMAYQLGPWFMELTNGDGSWKWPNLRSAAHSQDWIKASENCSVKQASVERNTHRKRLFQNAAQVEFLGLDPSHLWDTDVPKETDMPMTPEERAALVADIVAAVTPLIPTVGDIAEAVLDSKLSDVVPVGGKRGNLWLKNAIGEIHTAVVAKP